MTAIRISKMSPYRKSTWPIKGRGFGVIVGGFDDAISKLVKGEPGMKLELRPGELYVLSNGLGKSWTYPAKRIEREIEERGASVNDFI